jgi:hypothetical protein
MRLVRGRVNVDNPANRAVAVRPAREGHGGRFLEGLQATPGSALDTMKDWQFQKRLLAGCEDYGHPLRLWGRVETAITRARMDIMGFIQVDQYNVGLRLCAKRTVLRRLRRPVPTLRDGLL